MNLIELTAIHTGRKIAFNPNYAIIVEAVLMPDNQLATRIHINGYEPPHNYFVVKEGYEEVLSMLPDRIVH
jgi:hypothetical protein